MYNNTPSPVWSSVLNSSNNINLIFTYADVVLCYYILLVRQMYMNYCNITTFITKNLFIASILFWIHFYCGNCCNFQLSPSTKNWIKKLWQRWKPPQTVPQQKNSSVTEMDYQKANENMSNISESKWKHDKYDCILICINILYIYRVARG